MNDVNNISNSVLDSMSIANTQKEEPKKNEMGQEAFLKLLITQLENQDPLSPQDNGEFISQLAQFSSLEGVGQLNDTMDDMASSYRSSQALQASAMVGRSVMVPTDTTTLVPGTDVKGMLELPASTGNLKIEITSSSGELVSQLDLTNKGKDTLPSGEVDFTWDGKNMAGEQLPAGSYSVKAIAMQEGEPVQLDTSIGVKVYSVSLGADRAMTLNTESGDSVPFSEVKKIL